MVTGRDVWKLVGILWLCYLVTQSVLLLMLPSFRGKLTVEFLVLLNSVALFIFLLLPAILFGLKKGWRWREAFRWQPVSWQAIVATVLGTFSLGVAVSQVTLWLIHALESSVLVEQSKFTRLLLSTVQAKSPLLLLVAVMLPALPEELVFRGLVQQGFEKSYSPPVAIALTSFIFALFHLDPIQSLSVMAIALFWGWVAWRSQSVLPSLFAHALQNGLTVVSLISVGVQGKGFYERTNVFPSSPNWLVGAFGILFWVAMVLTLNRCLPKRGEKHGSTANGIFAHQTGSPNRSNGVGSSGIDELGGLEG